MAYTLITGASSGLGIEFAKLCAKDGHDLILVARNAQKLNEVATAIKEEYGVKAVCFSCDLSDEKQIKNLYDDVKSCEYQVDQLINNAGFGYHKEFLSSDISVQNSMINLNVSALVNLTYLFGKDMKARGFGKILNVSSLAAFCAGPYMSVYFASKAFVLSFSNALAEEFKGTGVSITALCLGPTATGFEKNAKLTNSKMFKVFKVANPQKVARFGYKKMQKGKANAFYGLQVKTLNVASKFLSRKMGAKFAKMVNGVPN